MRVPPQGTDAQAGGGDSSRRDDRAFGRFPNGVAFSETLSLRGKVVYAFRATFAPPFHLRERARKYGVMSICSRGMGKNNAREAIADFRRYISENQPRNNRCEFQAHSDMIVRPTRDFSIVQRKWFDGRLTLDQLAVLIIAEALMSRFGHVYVREIAAHLPFPIRRIERNFGVLLRLGLVERAREQSDDCYRVRPLENIRQKQGNGKAVNGNPGTIPKTTPLHPSYSLDQPNCFAPGSAKRGREDFLLDAHQDHRLLGWKSDLDKAVNDVLDDAEGHVDAIRAILGDETLRKLVIRATDGRYAPRLTSLPGLEAIRYLAAARCNSIASEEDERAAAAWSVGVVLQALHDRIGSRPGEWINSLQVIGKRMVARFYHDPECDRFYRSDTPQTLLHGVACEAVSNHPGFNALHFDCMIELSGVRFAALLAEHGVVALGVIFRELDRLQLDGIEGQVGFDHLKEAVARALDEFPGEEQTGCD